MDSAVRGRARVLLYPHAAIAAIFLAWCGGLLSEAIALPLFLAVHVALPIWCVAVPGTRSLRQRLLIGPGTIVGFYLALIAGWLLLLGDGPGDGTWIAVMMLLTMLGIVASYAFYCLVVFGVVATGRRHRR